MKMLTLASFARISSALESCCNYPMLLYFTLLCAALLNHCTTHGALLTDAPSQVREGDVGLYFTAEPRDITVARGSVAVLDCSAESGGNGGPVNITWRRNGEPFVPDRRRSVLNNGSLSFRPVRRIAERQRADDGEYECYAVNQIGAIMSRRAQLQIADLEPFSEQPADVTVTEGQSAYFRCSISGQPKPSIVWEKDRRTLSPSNRLIQLEGGVLQILNTTGLDSGLYRCRAGNTARERNSSEALLTLVSPPTG